MQRALRQVADHEPHRSLAEWLGPVDIRGSWCVRVESIPPARRHPGRVSETVSGWWSPTGGEYAVPDGRRNDFTRVLDVGRGDRRGHRDPGLGPTH